MNHDIRRTTEQATQAKLREVAEAGQAQGLWTITKHHGDDESATGLWLFAQLTTRHGHVYSLTRGGYSAPDKLCMMLTEHRQGAHSVTARDCYGMPTADAKISATRDTAAILKDFTRRVISNPDNVACANAMLARLADRQDSAATLRGHMATLEAMGYAFHNVSERENHSARGCSRDNGPQVTVYANGKVSFDASCDIGKLAAALAAMK